MLSARAENIVSILDPGRKLKLAHEPRSGPRFKARVHVVAVRAGLLTTLLLDKCAYRTSALR